MGSSASESDETCYSPGAMRECDGSFGPPATAQQWEIGPTDCRSIRLHRQFLTACGFGGKWQWCRATTSGLDLRFDCAKDGVLIAAKSDGVAAPRKRPLESNHHLFGRYDAAPKAWNCAQRFSVLRSGVSLVHVGLPGHDGFRDSRWAWTVGCRDRVDRRAGDRDAVQ